MASSDKGLALNAAPLGDVGDRVAGALGNKRQFVDATQEVSATKRQLRKERRRELYADQRRAAEIYRDLAPREVLEEGQRRPAGRGVTLCGWTQIAEQETHLIRTDEAEPRAFYRGLCLCGLRWACPVCTVKKSEESREQLNLALLAGRKLKLVPVMMTLTARHSRWTDLQDFWGRLSTAEHELKRSRPWKRLNKDYLAGGFAKAVEATYSQANGWHPHFHLVLMVEAKDEATAIKLVETLKGEWLHQLRRVDLDGDSAGAEAHAFHLRGAQEAGAYVAKWGAAEELSLGHSKDSKEKGLSPWQLLRAARTASDEQERQRMAALWWQFIQVFRGVHQLRQSPKFRALVEAGEVEKQAMLNEQDPVEEPAEVLVHNFGFRGKDAPWAAARWKRLRIIEAAEVAPLDDASAAVRQVIDGDQFDRDLCDDDDVDVVDDDDNPQDCRSSEDSTAIRPYSVSCSITIQNTTRYKVNTNGDDERAGGGCGRPPDTGGAVSNAGCRA